VTRTVAVCSAFALFTILGAGMVAHAQGTPAPTIAASPNPVPWHPDIRSTTIHWSTSGGSKGVVRVSLNGGPEQLFAEGPAGSVAANWIVPSGVFAFRLYSSADPGRVLASVTVTKDQPPAEPRVEIAPNSGGPGSDLATVAIAWTTGDQSIGEVHVARSGGAEQLLARGPTGSVQANWIDRTSTYDFTLYSVGEPRRRLAGATLAPATPASPPIQAPSKSGAPASDGWNIPNLWIWIGALALLGLALSRRLRKRAGPAKPADPSTSPQLPR
jgi:hypothetical protein